MQPKRRFKMDRSEERDGSHVKTQMPDVENPIFVQFRLFLSSVTIQSTCVIETGLSDFQLMTSTIMRKLSKS